MSDKKKLDPAIVADLKAKHGDDLRTLTAGGVTVIVKSPTRAVWTQFRAATADATKRVVALEQLCRSCIINPSPEDLGALFERKPGLAESFGSRLVELAGAMEEAEVGEL